MGKTLKKLLWILYHNYVSFLTMYFIANFKIFSNIASKNPFNYLIGLIIVISIEMPLYILSERLIYKKPSLKGFVDFIYSLLIGIVYFLVFINFIFKKS
uniref:Uncharacterized protein n=1 Tax=candidate division WOR-3 bacterium TaxID=2052148 RepID=A0A7C4U6T1_UNCW3